MGFCSIYPEIEVPQQDLWQFLFENRGRRFPVEHVILHDPETDKSLSYGDLKASTERFGYALAHEWSWNKGDLMGLLAPPHIDAATIVGGVHWAGGLFTGVNYGLPVEKVASQLKDLNIQGLVFHSSLATIAFNLAALAGLPRERLVVLDVDVFEGIPSWRQMCQTASPPESPSRPFVLSPQSDPAYIAYSSGTTALPKGIVLSHSSVILNFLQMRPGMDENSRWDADVVSAFAPTFTSIGLMLLLHYPAWTGVKAVIMSAFTFPKFLEYIQRFKMTEIFLSPPLAAGFLMLPGIEKFDLSSMTVMISAGSPLKPSVALALAEKFGIPVRQGYGMTEMAGTISLVNYTGWKEAVGSVGKLLANMEGRIVNPEGVEISPEIPGELWLKGPNMMQRYAHQGKDEFQQQLVDGFYKTGDIAYIRGTDIFICGRKDECIFTGDTVIYPVELEEIIMQKGSVTDVAVIRAFEGDKMRAKACVVLKASASPDTAEKEIVEHVSASLPEEMHLTGGVVFVAEIPKHPGSGKIYRKRLEVEYGQESQ